MASYCTFPACPGFHFKFDNCLIEALYYAYASAVGNADEECGDTSWRAYCWLILLPDGARIEASEWDGPADMAIGQGSFFILSTNDQGFVYLESFDDAESARKEYDAFAYEYDLWSAVDMGLEV